MRLAGWMDGLTAGLEAVLGSRRWIIGNAIGKCLDRLLHRPKLLLPADRIRKICGEYSNWKRARARKAGSSTGFSKSDIRRLEAWLNDLDQAFLSLLSSRRWKCGSCLDYGAFLGKTSLPIDHIADVLARYRQEKSNESKGRRAKKFRDKKVTLADYYYHLGQARERTRLWSKAADAYERALKLRPDRPGQYYRLGRVRGHEGLWQEAAGAFMEAVKRNPTRALWFFRLGHAYETLGKCIDAIHAHERAVALDASQPDWIYHLGSLYERNDRLTEAIDMYERAVQLDPKQAGWFYRLGRAREKTLVTGVRYLQHIGLQVHDHGDWSGAVCAYLQAVSLDDSRYEYHYRLGCVREKMRDYDGATESFGEAVKLAPSKPASLYRLARSRERRLDLKGALEAYKSLLALQSEHKSARARMYALHVKLARWADASEAALRCEEGSPPPPSSAGRNGPSYVTSTRRVRALLEQDRLPVTRAQAQDALREAQQHANALPVNWWYALHWRFIKIGWFSLAYEVKDIAAALIVAGARDLEVIGLTKYLEIAKAFVQLGSREAAIEHLQPILQGSAGVQQAQAAARTVLGDIDALDGDLGRLRASLELHKGVNLPEAEAAFHGLVHDRSVAIVGPVFNGLPNGAEIDSHDVVVRTNFLGAGEELQQAVSFGTRTDISYFNGVASQMLAAEIREAVRRGTFKMVVLRPSNYRQDRRLLVKPGDLRYNPGESTALLRARSFGIQRALHDILRYSPRSIKVFNADFFVSRAGALLADADPFYLGSGHDYRCDFAFTKRLRDSRLISGDLVVDELLELTTQEYLDILDRAHESATVGAALRGSPPVTDGRATESPASPIQT